MTHVGLDTVMSLADVPSCELILSARVVHVVSRKSPFIHTSAHSYELLSCLFISTAAGEQAAVSVKQNHS